MVWEVVLLFALSAALGCVRVGASHTNNWAVLVCTSTFWFNYRHVANVLSVYHIVKRLGIADDHIILMIADDMACNARNPFPASVFNHHDHHLNVYDESVEVDYRGSEVTVDNFIRLLTNRLPEGTPRSKRLATDETSNVLIYMTGHGGDNFLKFQDTEEINARDLADALNQMHEAKRYNELFLLVDTCQAMTLFDHISAPNVVGVASSLRGESSYSYHVDDEMGVAVLDRFTWALLEYSKSLNIDQQDSIEDFYKTLDPEFLHSHPEIIRNLLRRGTHTAKFMDFFGNIRSLDPTPQSYIVPPRDAQPGLRAATRFVLMSPDESSPARDRQSFDLVGARSIRGSPWLASGLLGALAGLALIRALIV